MAPSKTWPTSDIYTPHPKLAFPTVIAETRAPESNMLLRVWSSCPVNINGETYIELPQMDINDRQVRWNMHSDTEYPSNKLCVRHSYQKAASQLFAVANSPQNTCGEHMLLGGSSGIGKSCFTYYFIWRLFHPDGVEVTEVPDTIAWRSDPISSGGWVYHRGYFYKCISLENFFVTFKKMLDYQNAWIIYDGGAPRRAKYCNTLVITSSENSMTKLAGDKQYLKTNAYKIFLPPWTFHETVNVAATVHQFDTLGDSTISTRYKRFGGIPRYVLSYLSVNNTADPLDQALSCSNIITAITEAGKKPINISQVSGMLMHLIPDESLLHYTYEWGSIKIMDKAFERLFVMIKKKVTCIIKGPTALDLGSFSELLFEPYFYFRVSEGGYSGKCRRLLSPDNTRMAAPENHIALGVKTDQLETFTLHIPKMPILEFNQVNEIREGCFNVPLKCNSFSTIDLLCPDRGEVYCITKGERHDIENNRLEELRSCFAKPIEKNERVKFIFVVHKERFRDFTIQRIIDSKTEVQMSDSLLMDVPWIEQYVMEVDVTPMVTSFEKRVTYLVAQNLKPDY